MMQLKKLVCLMLALALLPLSAALAEEESYFTRITMRTRRR